MKHYLLLGVLLGSTYSACVSADGLDDHAACTTAHGITTICGFMAPEDIDRLPGENALVVGGFSLDNANGDIRVLNLDDGTIDIVFTLESDAGPVTPGWGDPQCPGPPSGFSAHGIHTSKSTSGETILLVVNHTSRESIEWFEISHNGSRHRAEWRGCVMVDEPYWVNDVAMLPAGGFVASHMMPRVDAHSMFDRPPNDKVETGFVIEWQPSTGWKKIEGSEGALPNGIQVSADGRTIYNNHYLGNQVVAIDRIAGKRLWQVEVEAPPDNVSITPGGDLLVAQHRMTLRELRDECMVKPLSYCHLPMAVDRINPKTQQRVRVLTHEGPPISAATVAVEAGEYIYLGTFMGNRIGRIPAQ